jgi:preprotein translocase subunit YajC
MFGTPAFAQTAAAPAAGAGGIQDLLAGPLPMVVLMLVMGYFLLFRPQQKKMKEHQSMISALKRGDTVVLSSGVIGKVAKIEDAELGVEIAPGVTIKVVRSMVSEVRSRTEPAAANDPKTS